MAKSKQNSSRADGDPGYKSDRKWAEKTLYECKACAYNTLDEKDIKEHVRLAHPTAPTVAEAVADATTNQES